MDAMDAIDAVIERTRIGAWNGWDDLMRMFAKLPDKKYRVRIEPVPVPDAGQAIVRTGEGTVIESRENGRHWDNLPSCVHGDLPPGDYDIRVEFRKRPEPVRIAWPWPDVSRVKLAATFAHGLLRQSHIFNGIRWTYYFDVRADLFGVWPADESRIARNVDGFVQLEIES